MAKFQPMLATAPAPEKHPLRFPFLLSPKLDGIRCIITPEGPRTRSLKPIPNEKLARLLSDPALIGLDGELIAGDPTTRGVMQRTTSAVMSHDGDVSAVKFHVFDHLDCFESPAAPFRTRIMEAERVARAADSWHVEFLKHERVESARDVDETARLFWAAGFEGAMLRDPGGLYKFGRATPKEQGLLKIKRWEHAEGRVVAVYERRHNENEQTRDERGYAKRSTAKAGYRGADTFGGITVTLGDEWESETVDIATGEGWTDKERAKLWAERDSIIGRIARYKFLPDGSKDAPRSPIWDAWRDPRDMS